MSWDVILSKQAAKDAKRLAAAGLKAKTTNLLAALLAALQQDPFTNPPPYEKLVGDLQGYYSRRINIQHRLIYSVNTDTKKVKVLRMWSHYE